MKKGVSTVIATLLMLVITIALVGFAYTYITGTTTARTGVVLGLIKSSCVGDSITVGVRNEGTAPSGDITVSATQPDGTTAAGSCTIASVNPGLSGECTANRAIGGTGTNSLSVSAAGAAPASGTVFCSTAGV
ncbi:MAG: hypothetical protein HY361_00340 [Candidatus Aenigmarchaeota archaeon]|nr:hypothetical protein [Candidatus Aenigmarchaeota archaeon]